MRKYLSLILVMTLIFSMFSVSTTTATAKSAVLKGDADGDGEITDWDAMLFERYLAAWNVEVDLEALDVDGDGEITDWDSMLFNRYLAGWDVEEFAEPTAEPTEEPSAEPTSAPAASLEKGDVILFGRYEQDNNLTNGQEDIEWIVLDVTDGKALLLSKYVLDSQQYIRYSDNPNTWETSTMRDWLNGEFYNAAFTISEKAVISSSTLIAGENPFYNTNAGKNTKDNVFLLSLADVANPAYGFSDDCDALDAARQGEATLYANAKGLQNESGGCSWWLRTPGYSSEYGTYVCNEGDVDYIGVGISKKIGVRPAITVDVEALLTAPAEPTPEPTPTPKPVYEPNNGIKAGDDVIFGKYEQDNDLDNGKEDIVWTVLKVEDGKALLLSRYALDNAPYNDTDTSVTWRTCSLRSWLNNDFYNAAFSDAEKSNIALTLIETNSNPVYGTSGGRNTTDKVFLLSIEDITNTSYGFSNSFYTYYGGRICLPTAYLQAKGRLSSDFGEGYNGNWYWWLRSPGNDSSCAAYIETDGSVAIGGYNVDYSDLGVRPALWISLESLPSPTPEPTAEIESLQTPNPDTKVGDIVVFGSYEQDNDLENGKEGIEWIVLDVVDGKALLLSKYILDGQRYNSSYGSVSWETCSLRLWLNNDFYGTAFRHIEKGRISETLLDNSGNPFYGTSVGNSTADNVFLLSIEDVLNTDYGFTSSYSNLDNLRSCMPTKYAKSRCFHGYNNFNYYYWWLRSTGFMYGFAASVREDGYLYYSGNLSGDGYPHVNEASLGVRPALWVELATPEPIPTPNPETKAGDTVAFGKYEQDNDLTNGQEDIEWIVLDVADGKALLMSKYALDCKPYNYDRVDVTWETCTLRTWLKNDFYNAAFNSTEKGKVASTLLANSNNPTYGTNGGNNTTDKVFLLSLGDINNTSYGFAGDYSVYDTARRCQPTEYAKLRGCGTSIEGAVKKLAFQLFDVTASFLISVTLISPALKEHFVNVGEHFFRFLNKLRLFKVINYIFYCAVFRLFWTTVLQTDF